MTGLTVACWLAAVGIAAGQATSPPGDSLTPFGQPRATLVLDASDSLGSMDEDIEVFRRILEGALPGPHGHLSALFELETAAFAPDGRRLATGFKDGTVRLWDTATGKERYDLQTLRHISGASGLEGVYLPNYGVVYSLTLPWHYQQPVRSAASPKHKPLGQWERVRQEVRGEKAKPEETKADQEEPSLADTVLKLLAENGRHFSQLAANERLTVAITLRPMQDCKSCHSGSTSSGATDQTGPTSRADLERYRQYLSLSALAQTRQAEAGKGSANQDTLDNAFRFLNGLEQAKPTEAKATPPDPAKAQEAANFAHLGDMRLKQGRAKEAAEAYQKAIAIFDQLLSSGQRPYAPETEAHVKLAQAYLLLGEREKAFASLLTQTQKAEKPPSRDKTSTGAAASALPAKLIVSATKSQLDQVGTGKISFEEFRKAATVQFRDFPATRKAPGKPSAAGSDGTKTP
jgi:tetratricopeptide (TPR) repeat protein